MGTYWQRPADFAEGEEVVAWVDFPDLERATDAPAVQGEPVGWVNSDELDNMLDDRTATLSPVRTGFHGKPVYAAPKPAGAALPPEITREMLGMIIDEVFGGGIEDASVIEDIYRVIARSAAPQPAEQLPAPGVEALVEALETLKRAATHESIHTGIQAGTALGYIAAICDVALAAHRSQGGE